MPPSNEFDEEIKIGKGGGSEQVNESLIRGRLSSPSYMKAAQSGKPQAVFKVASFAKGVAVRRVMEYVTRTDKQAENAGKDEIPAETEDGTQLTSKEDVAAVYDDWKQDFERKAAGRKTDPRHATHIVLSAKTDNSNKSAKQVHAAARDFLQKKFADRGFEYVFVVHRDTEHPHIHVVMKNKNRVLDKKLRIGKAELFDLRQDFATELNARGIEAVSTLRRDRPEIIEGIAKKIETVKNRGQMMKKRLKEANPNMAVDMVEFKEKQLLAVQGIIKDIGKETQALTPERKALKKSLRELQQQIIKADPVQVGRELNATIKAFEQDDKKLATDLKEILNPKKTSTRESRQESKKLKVAFNKYSEKYLNGIKKAMKDVQRNTTLTTKQRNETLLALRKQRRSVEKLKSKAFGLGI